MSWGRSTGFAVDPIEKKPFYHFKPGSRVLSFGTPGCNFRCLNCQNWDLSQALKTDRNALSYIETTTPQAISALAAAKKVDGIAYTYSEPTIFFEYARDTILACRDNPKTKNLFHVFVSNGFFSKECFEIIRKENLIDAINIDLKFINPEKYKRTCGGKLEAVQDTIKRIYELHDKIHMEIINLVIPDENDSENDLELLSKFVASVSIDIPLHFSRFYPQYKMSGKKATDLKVLLNAKAIAENIGIKYVYIGNTGLPEAENTYCPKCKKLLVERNRFSSIQNSELIIQNFKKPLCPNCREEINIIF
jgi:pyruvate formate lyase activating enzyme